MESYLFDEQTMNSLLDQVFLQTDLGQLYQSIPFSDLASNLNIPQSDWDYSSWLDTKGMLALMVLKHKLKLSDSNLLSRLNTDWAMQMFCGLRLKKGEFIRDKNFIWRVRKKLSKHLNINVLQGVLAKHWRPYIRNTNVCTVDATCYESYLRYPTDVKLLWEATQWLHNQLKIICKHYGVRMPRNKFKEQQIKTVIYLKTKRKTYKATRKRLKSLLYICGKLLGILDYLTIELNEVFDFIKGIAQDYSKRLGIIRKVYVQQYNLFEDPKYKPEGGRIVSLFKEYVRPIVRGKENKRVEFGAKVNKIQIDGISFIEQICFDAFNEGVRLTQSIQKHRDYLGFLSHISADKIYANNANRTYCKKQNIKTNFAPKGRKAKDEKQRKKMRDTLNSIRSTQLEGSFGNEKNNYLLQKIKARSADTEILWIFCGILTANASIITKRMFPPPKKRKRA